MAAIQLDPFAPSPLASDLLSDKDQLSSFLVGEDADAMLLLRYLVMFHTGKPASQVSDVADIFAILSAPTVPWFTPTRRTCVHTLQQYRNASAHFHESAKPTLTQLVDAVGTLRTWVESVTPSSSMTGTHFLMCRIAKLLVVVVTRTHMCEQLRGRSFEPGPLQFKLHHAHTPPLT
jgi:hypothetical protein